MTAASVRTSTQGLTVDILAESPQWDAQPDAEATVRRAIMQAAAVEGTADPNAEVSVLLCDDAVIAARNARWRGRDEPTNVLSFPAPPPGDPPRPSSRDIRSPAKPSSARRGAGPPGIPAPRPPGGLVFASLGYDHGTDGEAERMEQLEREILASLGTRSLCRPRCRIRAMPEAIRSTRCRSAKTASATFWDWRALRRTARENPESWLNRLLRAVFGWSPTSIRSDLQVLLEGEGAETGFSPEESRMLKNILSLRERRVDDVMVPRTDIIAVQRDVPLGDLLKVFKDAAHSRLVVYNDTLDDPVGMVHIRDMIAS
jgi:ssRNA-specific RNase YbeY (16S rRNA maturation enzyme)